MLLGARFDLLFIDDFNTNGLSYLSFGICFEMLIDFLNAFAKTRIQEDVMIGFMDYDWSLNE